MPKSKSVTDSQLIVCYCDKAKAWHRRQVPSISSNSLSENGSSAHLQRTNSRMQGKGSPSAGTGVRWNLGLRNYCLRLERRGGGGGGGAAPEAQPRTGREVHLSVSPMMARTGKVNSL